VIARVVAGDETTALEPFEVVPLALGQLWPEADTG
jgi:hypothetical protein